MKTTSQIGLDPYHFIERLCISQVLHVMFENIFFRQSFPDLSARISTLSKYRAQRPSLNDQMKLAFVIRQVVREHFRVNHGSQRSRG